MYLSELKVLDDGLDLLGLAVLQVEDGALPALARVPLGRRRGRRPRDLAQVAHREVPRRGGRAAADGGLARAAAERRLRLFRARFSGAGRSTRFCPTQRCVVNVPQRLEAFESFSLAINTENLSFGRHGEASSSCIQKRTSSFLICLLSAAAPAHFHILSCHISINLMLYSSTFT